MYDITGRLYEYGLMSNMRFFGWRLPIKCAGPSMSARLVVREKKMVDRMNSVRGAEKKKSSMCKTREKGVRVGSCLNLDGDYSSVA